MCRPGVVRTSNRSRISAYVLAQDLPTRESMNAYIGEVLSAKQTRVTARCGSATLSAAAGSRETARRYARDASRSAPVATARALLGTHGVARAVTRPLDFARSFARTLARQRPGN
jgi:hypothetical protein